MDRTWTGSPADEPLDDSSTAGWISATVGLGYSAVDGPPAPPPIAHWRFDGNSNDSSGNGQAITDRSAIDLLNNAGGQLLIYGVPFVALQLAGNLAGFTLATAVPAIAFLFVGAVCSYNAWRSGRVHCHFLGPWCLVAGTMTALYSLRIIDFGPDSWSLIVNTGLAGAALLYFGSERIWGRYFGHE